MKHIRSRPNRLAWEITLALLLKLLVVVGLKLVFFSAPPNREEIARELAARLAGGHRSVLSTDQEHP